MLFTRAVGHIGNTPHRPDGGDAVLVAGPRVEDAEAATPSKGVLGFIPDRLALVGARSQVQGQVGPPYPRDVGVAGRDGRRLDERTAVAAELGGPDIAGAGHKRRALVR